MKLPWTKPTEEKIEKLAEERDAALQRQQTAMRDLVVSVLNRAGTPWPKERQE